MSVRKSSWRNNITQRQMRCQKGCASLTGTNGSGQACIIDTVFRVPQGEAFAHAFGEDFEFCRAASRGVRWAKLVCHNRDKVLIMASFQNGFKNVPHGNFSNYNNTHFNKKLTKKHIIAGSSRTINAKNIIGWKRTFHASKLLENIHPLVPSNENLDSLRYKKGQTERRQNPLSNRHNVGKEAKRREIHAFFRTRYSI
jgi:hypothetical protein